MNIDLERLQKEAFGGLVCCTIPVFAQGSDKNRVNLEDNHPSVFGFCTEHALLLCGNQK
jgi:hypothetical protein